MPVEPFAVHAMQIVSLAIIAFFSWVLLDTRALPMIAKFFREN